ncbi:RNA-directed DNA polymerase, eukaryota [Tanacetum coccineum]|uniref:RNA-directed DNA polymerase, eukaryota n=1 Tax=Tanacetum coccineum TaxID=301880 RepID=A0ABQ5ED04_9ASTR
MAQKAKIRWAIEGDENSKYFLGIINKKRSQLAIRGVLVDGDWIDEPTKVKNEFLNHISNRFSKPNGPSINLDTSMFKQISFDLNEELESNVTYDEIERAIFKTINQDVINVVHEFFVSSKFPPGSNSSFITLIPKKQEAKLVKDFRPISLIGLFKGIRIDDSLTLSHLFYTDDAVFIGTWDKANVITIVHMLNCFFLASGLKINIQKSKLISAANIIGCNTFSTPFNYLGVKVALDNLGFVACSFPWINIIRELRSLSLKGNDLLSQMKKKMGNGSNTLYWKDSWITDSSCIHIYPRLFALECNKHTTVADKFRDISLTHSFRRAPRGGLEEEQYLSFVDKVDSVILPNSNDIWVWSNDSSGEFSVKYARSFIDESLLPTVGSPTRYVKVVSIKVNIFAWKVCLDKLPTRLNLSLLGIDILSISCPICSTAGESWAHLLCSCSMAKSLYRKVARWCEVDIPDFLSYEDWITWFSSLRIAKGFKDVLEGIFYVMWWAIWKFRNQFLFGTDQPCMALLFDEIVLLSFL